MIRLAVRIITQVGVVALLAAVPSAAATPLPTAPAASTTVSGTPLLVPAVDVALAQMVLAEHDGRIVKGTGDGLLRPAFHCHAMKPILATSTSTSSGIQRLRRLRPAA